MLPGSIPNIFTILEKKKKKVLKSMFLYLYVLYLGGGFGGAKESGQLRFGGKERPFKMPIQHKVDKL